MLATDGQAFSSLYLLLLKKVQRVDTMHLILVLIADALQGHPAFQSPRTQLTLCPDHEERIPMFVKSGETDPDMPYGPLLKCVNLCPS